VRSVNCETLPSLIGTGRRGGCKDASLRSPGETCFARLLARSSLGAVRLEGPSRNFILWGELAPQPPRDYFRAAPDRAEFLGMIADHFWRGCIMCLKAPLSILAVKSSLSAMRFFPRWSVAGPPVMT